MQQKPSSIFPERLDYIIQIRGSSNEKLAQLLFLSPTTISGYRNGRRYPDLDVFCDLCRFLNVSPDYLLGLSDEFPL